jgi:Clp amino terminal domain, pathogenicity island component
MAKDRSDLKRLIKSVESTHPPKDALPRVARASELAAELAETGDRLVDHFVTRARESGCSWAQIGSSLGVSKQAAQQRFSAVEWRWPRLPRRRSRKPLFSRFTERARQAVTDAQAESRSLKHNYIGTEHLLLGLMDGDGIASKALGSLGVTKPAVRDKIVSIVGAGDESPPGHIPFTPRSKKVLELSLRESLRLGHKYIGTEHILLGIVRESEGLGMQILSELKVPADAIEPKIKEILTRISGC